MKVLCVDDDAVNRQVVKGMLDVAGVETVEAADAQACLSLIDLQSFDAVLMDMRMPGMDGLEAVRHLRARGATTASLPIIVATADTGLHVRKDCLAAGADEVLQKPLEMRKLFNAIGTAMAQRSGSVIS
jgi:CheY-like chemotaxis protein